MWWKAVKNYYCCNSRLHVTMIHTEIQAEKWSNFCRLKLACKLWYIQKLGLKLSHLICTGKCNQWYHWYIVSYDPSRMDHLYNSLWLLYSSLQYYLLNNYMSMCPNLPTIICINYGINKQYLPLFAFASERLARLRSHHKKEQVWLRYTNCSS